MDSKIIIDRIKDLSLLQQDDAEKWVKLSRVHPYFSIGQWLKYGRDYFNDDANLPFVAIYKNEPFEFAQFNRQLNLLKNGKFETNSTTILTDDKIVQVEEDAIEAIESENTKTEFEEKIGEEDINSNELSNELINTETLIENNIIQDEEVIQSEDKNATDVQDDILSLIQDLPNTSPFEHKEIPQSELNWSNATHSSEMNMTNDNESSTQETEEDKSLLVMMSFTDWLNHFKHKNETEKEEILEKKALKTAWQKEKLAEAADEELDEIPEPIFKQAMESISMESGLISESLAEILSNQGKKDKAIAMYKKLSLRNPKKSAYFADRINELNLNLE